MIQHGLHPQTPLLSKRSTRGFGLSPSKYSRHSVPFMHAMTLGTGGAAPVSPLWRGNLAIWRWKLSTKSWRIQDKLGTIFRCRRSTLPWSPKLCRWVTFLQFKHADLGTQVNTPSGAGDAQIGTGPNDQTAWAKASTVWRFWVASVATKLLETAGLQNRSHHFLVISRKPWSGLASNIYIYKYICI